MDEMDRVKEDKKRFCSHRSNGDKCGRHRTWIIGLLIVAGVVGLTVTFNANALGAFGPCSGWHGHASWRAPVDASAIGKHLQNGVERLFKKAEASAEQTEQGRAVVAAATETSELEAMIKAHRAIRNGFIASLSAPTIDRIELEALRVKAIEQVDTNSKRIVKMAGDLAEVLTPTQRKRLANLIDETPLP